LSMREGEAWNLDVFNSFPSSELLWWSVVWPFRRGRKKQIFAPDRKLQCPWRKIVSRNMESNSTKRRHYTTIASQKCKYIWHE
jgi:hypothetical protein